MYQNNGIKQIQIINKNVFCNIEAKHLVRICSALTNGANNYLC